MVYNLGMRCELIGKDCTNMKNGQPQCYNGCDESWRRGNTALTVIEVKCPKGFSQNITGSINYPNKWNPSLFVVRQQVVFTNGDKKQTFERRVEINSGKLTKYSCQVE